MLPCSVFKHPVVDGALHHLLACAVEEASLQKFDSLRSILSQSDDNVGKFMKKIELRLVEVSARSPT